MPLGFAYIQTMANFDPNAAAFEDAMFEIAMNIAGVTLDGALYVTPEGSGLKGSLYGQTVAGIPYQSILYFNVDRYGDLVQTGCDVVFSSAEIQMSGAFLECCPNTYISGTLTFDCNGFEELVLETSIDSIPSLPWLGIWPELTFTLEEKTLDLRAGISPGYFEECFEMYFSLYLDYDPLTIEDIWLAGVSMECSFGGVNFEGVSQPDSSMSARLRTRSIDSQLSERYWEYYRIWTTEEACCGPLTFEGAFYFHESSPMLMGLAAIQALFQIDVGSGFVVGMALEFDLMQPAGDQWVYGDFYFEYSW